MAKVKSNVKPETEIRLSELQESYLKDRNKEDYDKMFILLLTYSKSLLLKLLRGKVFLNADTIDEYAIGATIKMMSEYKKPNHKIDLSFAGLLRLKLIEELWAPRVKRSDQIASLNEHIENGKSTRGTEVGDLAESLGFTYMWRPESEESNNPLYHIVNPVSDAINSASSVIDDLALSTDLHTMFVVSMGLIQYIDKSKTYDRYVATFLNQTQRDILDQSILEIYKRLQEAS